MVSRVGQRVSAGGQSVSAVGQRVSAVGHFVSEGGQRVSATGQRVLNGGQRVSTTGQNVSPDGQRVSATGQRVSATGQRVSRAGQRVSTAGQKVSPEGQTVNVTGQCVSMTGQRVSPAGQRVSATGQSVSATGQRVRVGGQRVSTAGQTVATAGQRVSATGQAVSVGGQCVSAGGQRVTTTGQRVGCDGSAVARGMSLPGGAASAKNRASGLASGSSTGTTSFTAGMRARKKMGDSDRETGKGLEAFQRSCHGPFGPEETWRMPSPFHEITTHVPETQAAVSFGAYSSSGSRSAIDAGSIGPSPGSSWPNAGKAVSGISKANPRYALKQRVSMDFMAGTRFAFWSGSFPWVAAYAYGIMPGKSQTKFLAAQVSSGHCPLLPASGIAFLSVRKERGMEPERPARS
jgi:hypothetical protein